MNDVLRKIHTRELDVDEVHPRLWVGSAPHDGVHVAQAGFSHLILCSIHYQRPAHDFPGVVVVHAPFEDDDSVMRGDTMALVTAAARAACEAHKSGGNVLVTCTAGINRSALAAALALQMLGLSPWISVERIRTHRNYECLSNTCFCRIALRQNRQIEFYLGKWEEP